VYSVIDCVNSSDACNDINVRSKGDKYSQLCLPHDTVTTWSKQLFVWLNGWC